MATTISRQASEQKTKPLLIMDINGSLNNDKTSGSFVSVANNSISQGKKSAIIVAILDVNGSLQKAASEKLLDKDIEIYLRNKLREKVYVALLTGLEEDRMYKIIGDLIKNSTAQELKYLILMPKTGGSMLVYNEQTAKFELVQGEEYKGKPLTQHAVDLTIAGFEYALKKNNIDLPRKAYDLRREDQLDLNSPVLQVTLLALGKTPKVEELKDPEKLDLLVKVFTQTLNKDPQALGKILEEEARRVLGQPGYEVKVPGSEGLKDSKVAERFVKENIQLLSNDAKALENIFGFAKRAWDPEIIPGVEPEIRHAIRVDTDLFIRKGGGTITIRTGGTTSSDASESDKLASSERLLLYVSRKIGVPIEELRKETMFGGDQVGNPNDQEFDVAKVYRSVQIKYYGSEQTNKPDDVRNVFSKWAMDASSLQRP